jgi:hypothetical protein
MVLIRRLSLALLAVCATALATIPNPLLQLGFGSGATCGSACGGGGTALSITTASLNSCVVGATCTQNITATGGTNTGYKFSKVSEYPNTDFWDNIMPSGLRTGTPEYAETETVTYQVTDSGGHTAQKSFALVTAASGSLAIVSPATLPTAALNGYYAYRELASGGIPPYTWSASGVVQPCNLTFEGWLICSPNAAGTTSFTVTVTDANGATATLAQSFTTSSALKFGRVDPVDGVVHFPSGYAGSYYRGRPAAYGGTPPYTYTATGLPSWATLNSSTGAITGTPTSSGNVLIAITATDSASSPAHATANALINISSAITASRPSGNTSSAFFLNGNALYDANGKLFRLRGVNQLHFGNASTPSTVQNTGANAVRIWDGNHSTATYLSLANGYIANGIVPILTQSYVPGGGGTSGDTSDTDLQTVVTWWVSNESAFVPIMNKMMLNIANEWNGSSSANWASTYESMLPQLRTAGYTCPIIIDADGQGENLGTLITYGAAVIAADPMHNTMLAWHGYRTEHYQQIQIASITTGSSTTTVNFQSNSATAPFPNWVGGYYVYNAQGATQLNGAWSGAITSGSAGSWHTTLNTGNSTGWGAYVANSATIVLDTVDQGGNDAHYRRAGDLIVSSGLPIIMGEFGPGNRDTASNNFTGFVADADYGQTIAGLENYNTIGWIEWAYDDNNQTGCTTSFANWWGLVQASCSSTAYPPPTGLTGVGLDVVPNPRRGLDALGIPADSIHP